LIAISVRWFAGLVTGVRNLAGVVVTVSDFIAGQSACDCHESLSVICQTLCVFCAEKTKGLCLLPHSLAELGLGFENDFAFFYQIKRFALSPSRKTI
jgi:hypothetical protein